MIHSNGVTHDHGLKNPRFYRLVGEGGALTLKQVSAKDLPDGQAYDAVLSAEEGRTIAVEIVDPDGKLCGFAIEGGVENSEFMKQLVIDYGFTEPSRVAIDRN